MAAGMVDRRSEPRGTTPGRRHVERRVYIRASPRRVWATLHDQDQFAALFAELTAGPGDPSWPAAGSSRAGEAHLGLLRTAVRIESVEARPLTAFAIVVAASSFAIEWGWRMEPLAGGTRVIHDGSFQTTDRWAGVLVRLGRESIDAIAEAHLRALKERAEASAGEAAGPAA
jgi:Polyketide cyclase / dehydrase and lipid transport